MSTRDREQTESTDREAGRISLSTRDRQWCWCEVRQDGTTVLADEKYWNSTTSAEQIEDGDGRELQIVHWNQEAGEQ
jgi:hypothetical protein